MERSEPTLVPEWLKNTGSINGAGNANHHSGSSSSHSDNHVTTHPTRSRSSMSIGDYTSPRSSVFLDRTTSAYFDRSSNSNGSIMHEKDNSAYSRSYSSFGRNHRDRGREKNHLDLCDKKGLAQGDHRDRNHSTLLGTSANFLLSIENDKLRRTQTMIKRGEMKPRQVVADLNSGTGNNNNKNNNHVGDNCVVVGGSTLGSLHKAAFERDYPSLGAEERQGASDIARLSSPGLSTAVQSLPMGSALIGGDGWTSALAEVPVSIGSNSMGPSLGSVTLAPNTMAGLNMAETLAQAPSRVRTPPQVSIETQRLEELAIKQSRQLIPVTPSMPKSSVLNSDKSKPKVASKSEVSLASKIGNQQLSSTSSQLVNRGGAARSDVTKSFHIGKLQVLKATRENNGISPTSKDGSSPTNAGGRVANNPFTVAPSAMLAPPLRSPNNQKLTAATRTSSMEKRPIMSQTQSRNEFFNLMRKKSSINVSSTAPDPSPVLSSTALERSGESITEVATVPVSPQSCESPSSDPSCLDWSTESAFNIASNGDACQESQKCHSNGEKHLNGFEVVDSDEKEVAFLRLLGWKENSEVEGLTEEEINEFYKEYMKLKPSLNTCRGIRQQKLLLLPNSHVSSYDDTSSGLSSSDSESEA